MDNKLEKLRKLRALAEDDRTTPSEGNWLIKDI